MRSPDTGLADRLVRWMADNRKGLDAMMVEEGSRAIHEEFLLAEGGTLPDRATRIERARGASARAWMRHLGHAMAEVWPGADPALPEKMRRWNADHPERLEAHVLEEQAVLERRGASGDPHADQRDAELAGHSRTFAEMLASLSEPVIESSESPPDFARRIASWARGQEAHRREIPVLMRPAVLAKLMADYRTLMVTGTHGKTTTTSMLTVALQHGGFDPSFAVGGDLGELRRMRKKLLHLCT